MTEEVWKDIALCNGKYKVSNMGRVKSMPNRTRKGERIMKLQKYKSGYMNVDLCYDGVIKKILVHRLVAFSFIPNPDDKPQVNHINGVKDDNRQVNLEWNTRSENQKHSIRIGLRSAKGVKNSQSKLNDSDVINILSDDRSAIELSNAFKISVNTIYDIKSRRTWKHLNYD